MIDPLKVIDMIVKHGEELWQKRYWLLSLNIRRLHKNASKQFNNKILLDFLEHQYSNYQLLKVNSKRYPVVVFLNAEPIILNENDPTTILEPLSKFKPKLITKHFQYYWAMRSVIPSYENKTFILEKLTLSPTLSIRASVSKFFDVLLTSYSLEWEILNAIAKKSKFRNFDSKKLIKYLPLRWKLHEINSDPVINGEGRAAGIAVSVLLAYKDSAGNIKLMLKPRGSLSISLRLGMLSVLPSGNFQALMEKYDTEYNLFHWTLWEYLEELFDEKDPDNRRPPAKWFYNKPQIVELREMLKNKTATLLSSGIAVDLLNLRPEFLLTLYISDPKWIEKHEIDFNPNSECGIEDMTRTFNDNADEFFQMANLNPNEITAPSAAALWAGIRTLNKILK